MMMRVIIIITHLLPAPHGPVLDEAGHEVVLGGGVNAGQVAPVHPAVSPGQYSTYPVVYPAWPCLPAHAVLVIVGEQLVAATLELAPAVRGTHHIWRWSSIAIVALCIEVFIFDSRSDVCT